MLLSNLRRDFVRTWFTPLAVAPFSMMEMIFRDMEMQGREAVGRSSIGLSDILVTRGADMRYVGQEHAVSIDLPQDLFAAEDRNGIKRCFDAVHEARYGYAAPDEPAEMVSLRSTVTGL